MTGNDVLPDEPAQWIDAITESTINNGEVEQAWAQQGGDVSLNGRPLPAYLRPTGFLYPLEIRAPHECLIEGIGADITGG